MDGQIKMPLKRGLGDEDMIHIQDLYASPAKSDASSIDIYDGLDVVTSAEQSAETSSPSKNCLDLYEEILTEEGAAKEASFSDLHAEYEKCQRQMKRLITKLKEMHSMNSNLQNENQCLKKNISALIKTARVEITRKEDEINRLNTRGGASRNNYRFRPNLLPESRNKLNSNNEDLSKNINTESLPKQAIHSKSKDITSGCSQNLCDKEKSCVDNSQVCTINPIAKQSKDSSLPCSQEQTLQPLCLELSDKSRKENDMDSQNKDFAKNRKKEMPKSSFESSDLKEKSCQSLLKCGKSESSQENRNSKLEVGKETKHRKYHSGSTKEKTELKESDYSKEKHMKKSERSPRRRESKAYEKEKNLESRQRTPAEKNEELRRSTRTHFSTQKDDGSRKVSEPSDAKKSSDVGRKDKRSLEYSESKHGNKDSKASKSENSRHKPNHEHKTERSDRDRRGDEKKRSRDEQDRSRHEHKDKGHQTKKKDGPRSSSKDTGLHSKVQEKNRDGEKAKVVDSIPKDLKLSFMETLNLTLSPAKKTSADTEQVDSSMARESEGTVPKSSSQLCVVENQAESLHSEKNDGTTGAPNVEDSKLVSQCQSVVDTIACLNEQPTKSAVEENIELLTELTIEDKPVVCTVLDTVNSEDIDTHSLGNDCDLIDLDSFIEIDRCSGSPASGTHNVSAADEQIQDDGSICKRSEDQDNAEIKSDLTETPKGICESPDTDVVNVSTKGIEDKPCFHDEGSFDLNFMRHIPKVLSPLKSPVRPKAHLHTLERTAKAPAVSILHKELLPETDAKSTSLLVPEELNKENCQPDNNLDHGSKTPEVVSPDELEEGEILSDEEQICQQKIQPVSEPSNVVPEQVTSVNESPSGQDSEPLPVSKPEMPILPKKKRVTTKKVKIDKRPKVPAFPTTKQRKPIADCCLDKVLKIVTPLSIQDVLQMLRIIRKHVRKKYMKFKVQFTVNPFHGVIDAASLYFVTLVKTLDWSSLCSSPQGLQKNLCSHIETRLKKLKKSSCVERIFESYCVDMKQKLWKFVEEQFDSLFDILKAELSELCDKAETDKNTSSSISPQKNDPVISSHKKRSKRTDKVGVPSPGSLPCLRRLEFHRKARVSNSETQSKNDNAVQKEFVKELTESSFNSEKTVSANNVSPTSKHPPLSPGRNSVSEPCPKNQLSSSGLSFNLVSDDHMGDVFKSLLHNADNLPPDTIPESMSVLESPEKTVSSQKPEEVDSLSENKTPTKETFSWSFNSPPTFSGLESVLNPDVFDESCMLEIPCSTSSSKSLNSSEDRQKSYSSVLLEDLAVSLTVPSPLKSDSHLSFLRPTCNVESVSEVDVNCSEEVLDEEDATEQDIHLTLDSDNSSIASLEDIVEAGSFHYHPSEPMQAVIMEKSNDHFVVKIRRAVSSSSPVSDGLSEGTGNAAPGSLRTVEDNALEMKARLDTRSEAPNGSILLLPNDSDLASITQNSVSDIERPEGVSFTVQDESLFKLPPNESQDLEIPADLKPTSSDVVESAAVECEKNITNSIEETCSPVPPADPLPVKASKAVDLNSKKRKTVNEEPSAKRQKRSPNPSKPKDTKHNKMKDLDLEKPYAKKHGRTLSEGSIPLCTSKDSPTSLSAKNVVKKKGEVIVSWTRDEDRTILLECQKLGPIKKTFLYLSSTMNKYPHQVEERFRQLMKLFKKSRNSTS